MNGAWSLDSGWAPGRQGSGGEEGKNQFPGAAAPPAGSLSSTGAKIPHLLRLGGDMVGNLGSPKLALGGYALVLVLEGSIKAVLGGPLLQLLKMYVVRGMYVVRAGETGA